MLNIGHKKKNMLLMLLLFAGLAAGGCGKKEPVTQSGFYFDTVISVTLYDDSRTRELEHCFELADLYEHYFSTRIADSDISKINTAAGKPVLVHDETLELIQKGLSYAKLSEGKFDITVGKLTDLWDFQGEDPVVPDGDSISAAAASVDYRNVSIKKTKNGGAVTLSNPKTAIDLGGIAKGYIADQMKDYLQSEGITSGLINLGGNVLTIGEKENGEAYTIGIQKPFDETGAILASIEVKDQSVVTSGTYERYFTQDGRNYHHILDTATGYPYENGITGVSIICPYSVDGDALSTTCFALGLNKGMELVESLENTEALFIMEDHSLYASSGIGKTVPIQILDKEYSMQVNGVETTPHT